MSITHPNPSYSVRDVYLGWVEGWDDDSQLFLISFGETQPSQLLLEPIEEEYFEPFDVSEKPTSELPTRPGQHKFRFLVFQRYRPQCAVCNIDIPQLLDTAHLIPKSENGSDDPRNGLVLCATHHRALEAGLFGIHPETLTLHYHKSGPDKAALHILYNDINHLMNLPHVDALNWLWENTFS